MSAVVDSGDPALPDLETLLSRLKDRVEQRRAVGDYPAGLQDDLDRHFGRMVDDGREPATHGHLYELVARLKGAAHFAVEESVYHSQVPGGEKAHRLVGRLVTRYVDGLIEQLKVYSIVVNALLKQLVDAVQDPPPHFHGDLWGHIDTLGDRVARYERNPAVVANLARRVEALEQAEARRDFRPWYDNTRFEDAFRGSRQEMLDQYGDLAARFDGCSPVLDIGCGRGEFVELLIGRDIDATGIEIDRALVESVRAAGLPVQHGDGVVALANVDDGSLGGLSLIQVIEHLSSQQAVDLVALAAAKLRPGGKVVIETVNPQSLYVFAHAFFLDPTHSKPVHPAYLTFLFREAGFAEVDIDWRSPPPQEEVLVAPASGGGEGSENVRRLNQLLFAPQDYALVATR